MPLIAEVFPVEKDDFVSAGEVSAKIKRTLKKLGVDSSVLRRISVCSYEVELNLVIHSLGGTIDFSVDEDGVTLLIRDRGPGIPDLDLAMREGWSTAPESVRNMGFGAGMGLPNMKRNADEFDIQSTVGVGWAQTGGEMLAVGVENSLAVDGIENVIQVLESIENGDLADLDYFEGLACVGGCLGGPLTFENTYVAKNRLRKLTERLPKISAPEGGERELSPEEMHTQMLFQPNPAMKLDDDFAVALRKMEQIERVLADLPGLDCGSCGSPSCRALAEDVVLGHAVELDCIFKLKQKIQQMSKQMVDIAEMTRK